jgi:hypothetical protein
VAFVPGLDSAKFAEGFGMGQSEMRTEPCLCCAVAIQLFALALFPMAAIAGATSTEGSDCSNRLDAPKDKDANRPVLVLVETNPWAMVLGSDSPRFALYDNGLAIYRTKNGFRQVQLNKERADAFRNAVNVGALACLNEHYSTIDATDQPTEFFFFGRGGRLSQVSVYGGILGKGEQAEVPAPLVAAYERLVGFDDPNSKPWLPDYIEVMVWPYEYAPEPSIIWPSEWPGLRDPRTRKWNDGKGYSLYVPSTDSEELRAFLRTEHEKGAVEIGGKKWSVSIRFPFPQESKWHFTVTDPE